MDSATTQVITVPDKSLAEVLQRDDGRVNIVFWPDGNELSEDIRQVVTGVVLPYQHDSHTLHVLNNLPALKWVQTQSTGYDNVLNCLPTGVKLSNAAGVHAASTAELAIGLVIASLRNIDIAAKDMLQGVWREQRHKSLQHRKVLVLGAGNIGDAIASRLMPFEVILSRISRTARTDEIGEIMGFEKLTDCLPHAEIVILALPLTGETKSLVDHKFLSLLPDDALLVNVGRGGVVVTDDLINELNTGRLHAALDVVDPEPLHPDHSLWECPNLLITPHLGGNTTAFVPGIRKLLTDQIARLNNSQCPLNLVN
ncbi:hypothetical protein HA49_12370 [Tatumella morbirosei]|uniref:2-hydroxyacid dehydrogenase n=1 Tax=Tatumella morbirosei TaxID=642227 RepID=A0A095VE92_9GAMM|nr:NAD(P)-dependent oxidoreductase [Tatumella morbirosei]KGD72995.1 hypothetical protein HA49_12370 [Tatumella morbirosei]